VASVEWGVELLRAGVPAAGRDLVVILGPPRGSAIGAIGERDPSASCVALAETMDRLREQLGPGIRGIVDWGASGGNRSPPVEELSSLRAAGTIADFAVPFTFGDAPGTDTTTEPPLLRSGPLSLLDVRVVNSVLRARSSEAPSLIARDVYAGGALDGQLLQRSPLERGPTVHPESMAELHSRLDPVLQLAFLTKGHRRTLPRAALTFALQWPWVLTAVIPLPTADRWERLLGPTSDTPLEASELRRLGVAIPSDVGDRPTAAP
jgi:hypothetical protein